MKFFSFQLVEKRTWSKWLVACALAFALLVLTGCSAKHFREATDKKAYQAIQDAQKDALGKTEPYKIGPAENTLRERLLLGQNLPTSGPASLGARFLEPIDHWPKDNYLTPETPATIRRDSTNHAIVRMTLVEALQVAAANSREYQDQKERVFEAALALDLQENQFRTTFAGLLSGEYELDKSGLAGTQEEVSLSTGFSATQKLKSGAEISVALGWNLLKLLDPGSTVSDSFVGDVTVSVPLMRGSGEFVVTEGLTQAQRNMVYSIYRFESFKRSFAVQTASRYFDVLERANQVTNEEENYRGLITSTRRARRLLDKGDLPAIQVDQAIQDELAARNRWILARASLERSLNDFKFYLGLPVDATIALDDAEFSTLSIRVDELLEGATDIEYEETIPPADAPIVLQLPQSEKTGPLEMAPEVAIDLALEHRLDLRIANGSVYDAQRKVTVAADGLRAELTLFGAAALGGDSLDEAGFDSGRYRALLNLDLPLERTREAVVYRQSYLNLESAVRQMQELEDAVKLAVTDALRVLAAARETLRIQALSVELARRRVRGTELFLSAGRAEIRDVLDARESLLSSQNAFTAAMVNYRVAELELQRDLGLLEVGPDGLWTEYEPTT